VIDWRFCTIADIRNAARKRVFSFAFVASYLGRAMGWYAPGEGAGLIGAVVGAIVVLAVWAALAKRRA
jgi:hypothetical protein